MREIIGKQPCITFVTLGEKRPHATVITRSDGHATGTANEFTEVR